jgi:hypothetical protein
MDAAPLLIRTAKLLRQHNLEAILIGNAAAAVQGAPVSTIDLDFLFRKTPANMKKLKALAISLDAMLWRSCYPTSGLYRISRDEDGLQLDFLTAIYANRSFEGLRKRAKTVQFGGAELLVEPLRNRLKPPTTRKRITRKAQLAALKKESELAQRDQIRRLMALPPERRTNFLRKRLGYRISCL